MPFSEDQIKQILSKYQYTWINPIAAAAQDEPITVCTTTVTESGSTTATEMSAASVMSFTELRLLRAVIFNDPVMAAAIRDEQLLKAAQRWNSLVKDVLGCKFVPYNIRRSLHIVTEDVLRKGLTAVTQRDQQLDEQEIVSHMSQHPETALTSKSAAELPFTEYETRYLTEQIPRHIKHTNAKKRINWDMLQYTWRAKLKAELLANQQVRLHPRSKDTLKGYWLTIERRHKSDNDPSNDTMPNVENNHNTASPVVDNNQVDINTNGSTDNNLSNHTTSKSTGHRWSADATAYFKQLYNERNGRWTYDEFCSLWPTDLYGSVTSKQWSNKNGVVSKKRKTKV